MAGTKDWWDKAQAIGSLLSGIAVPLVVFVAAHKADELQKLSDTSARERELTQADMSVRVAQANIIPPLIDGLLSTDPKRRKLAISAILIALPADGPRLVRELGEQTEDEDVRSYAANALDNRKEQLVTDLYASDKDRRKSAAQALASGYRNDPKLPEQIIERADANKDNADGVYNSVAVLNALSKNALASQRGKVESFLGKASTQGNKTAALAERVRTKLDAPDDLKLEPATAD